MKNYPLPVMPNFHWSPADQVNTAPSNPPHQRPYQQPPSTDYPVDALTGVLGSMFHTVCASGIDPPVVGAVFKSTASALTKGIVDIEWPNRAVTRVGINDMVVAGTCSGKTHALNIAKSPIITYLYAEENTRHAVSPLCFFEDSSRAALIKQLSENPIGFLSSDEGDQLVPLFQKGAASLAKLLDGETVRYARSTTGRVEVPNPCLTALVELQPEVFQANKSAFGVGPGSIAVINRFLVANSKCEANTIKMYRYQIPDPVLIKYELRVETLLAHLTEQRKNKLPRPVLRLSPEAREFLIWTGEEIKSSMSPAVLGHDISLYLGRHAERVLKQAGVLHAFEYGAKGEVELATVRASDRLARWSCKSFHELTYSPPPLSQLDIDAITLERELWSATMQTGLIEFKYSEVRRYSPNIGLTTQRFTRAFAKLAGTGRVQLRRFGRTDWVQVVPPQYWGDTGSPRLID